MDFIGMPFYVRDTIRGAGYQKYVVVKVTQVTSERFNIVLESTFKKKYRYETMFLKGNKLIPEYNKLIFHSAVEYFVYMHKVKALWANASKNKQYEFELKEIKHKYPEHFL